MKNKIKKTVLACYCIITCMLAAVILPVGKVSAYAGMATSYTYSIDADGNFFRTQDAYLPDRTVTNLSLMNAEDLYIDAEDILYIADTGNRRIIRYDILAGKVVDILESTLFSAPRGIFVAENGNIYVADSGAKQVFIFDKDFNLIQAIGKPDSPIFSDSNFEPKKIGVDKGGNMFIVGEGVYSGIIQLAPTGEFLGYFASNKARLTVAQYIQHFIFTREQLANSVAVNPSTFSNVFVDNAGIVYTATSGTHSDGVRKHNTSGGDMFPSGTYSDNQLTDVYVDANGFVYTSSVDGWIDVYSKSGDVIFDFGSSETSIDIAGLFVNLKAIAVDSRGYIWCVDSTKGYIQSFKPTEYAYMIFSAMDCYENGKYEESMEKWNEVLKLNQMSTLAHNGVAKALFREENYREAMKHFEVAENRELYSEAFWEVRNEWLQKYLQIFFFGIIILTIAVKIVGKLDREHRIKNFKKKCHDKIFNLPVLKDVLYALKIPRHPMDAYYEIRKKRKGTMLGATIIYLILFVVFLLYQTSKGFIYQMKSVEDLNINAIVIGYFVVVILFIISNYLVTSINDGDGDFRQVYMIPAYGMAPVMISMTIVIFMSYLLTYNESFMLDVIMLVGIVWTVVSIFTGLQVVHDYTFGETIRSLIITVVFMIIAAIIGIIISIMWDSLYQFIVAVGKELLQNVF